MSLLERRWARPTARCLSSAEAAVLDIKQIKAALKAWEQANALDKDPRALWRALRQAADTILTMREGENLSLCRPVLLKSLVNLGRACLLCSLSADAVLSSPHAVNVSPAHCMNGILQH